MKYKIVLMMIALILMLSCSQAWASERDVIPIEAKGKIAEQYRLEPPAPVSPDWSRIDMGISAPVDLFIKLCRFLVNPLVFTVNEIFVAGRKPDESAP